MIGPMNHHRTMKGEPIHADYHVIGLEVQYIESCDKLTTLDGPYNIHNLGGTLKIGTIGYMDA
jgi:hypothetical protein